MLMTSVVIYVILQNLVIGHIPIPVEGEEQVPLSERPDYDFSVSTGTLKIFISFGKLASIGMLLLAAVFHPSAINGIYFLIFLGSATWWACAKELERGFGILLRCTVFIFIIHITTFMVYQTPWPQEILDKNSTIARVLGYTPLISSYCGNISDFGEELSGSDLVTTIEAITEVTTEVLADNSTALPGEEEEADLRVLIFNKYNVDYYLNPLFLLLCYYTISITSTLLLGPKVSYVFLKVFLKYDKKAGAVLVQTDLLLG